MSKSTKIIAGLGTVAALGISFMPFAGIVSAVTSDVTLSYTIDSTLALALDAGTVTEDLTPGTADTSGSTSATISGNSAYQLTVKSDGADANLDNGTGGTITPIAAAAASVPAGQWGIKIAATAGATTPLGTTNFNAVTTTDQVIMTRATIESALSTDDVANVTYGVNPASNQPSGTYTDTLTYTATAL